MPMGKDYHNAFFLISNFVLIVCDLEFRISFFVPRVPLGTSSSYGSGHSLIVPACQKGIGR